MSTLVKGTEVKFLHQAKGKSKEKTGFIVGFIAAGQNGMSILPDGVKNSQIEFQPVNDKINRILVAVHRGGKSSLLDYFAPYELSVKPVE